jgi:signal transduction histidine kinase
MNLVSNASKYSEEGRVVRVSVSRRQEHRVGISVEDEGSGIPVDEHDRIFERFYRVKHAQSGGSGLGLPISRMIAEVHGGQIRIESEEGRNTRVLVDFPAPEA